MVIDCGVTVKIDGEANVMVRVADNYKLVNRCIDIYNRLV